MPVRDPISPAKNVVTGGISAAFGQAVSLAIVSSNPELLPFAAILGTALTGTLNGIGNAARTTTSLWGKLFAWIG